MYVDHLKPAIVPQVYTTPARQQLLRFLILGSDKPTFYASAKELTVKSVDSIQKLIRSDGRYVVDTLVEVITTNRVPLPEAVLFTLALCLSADSLATRQYAEQHYNTIVRTGNDQLYMAATLKKLGKSGKIVRRVLSNWYLDKPVNDIAYQVIKYANRHNWRHSDVLRVAHPATVAAGYNNIFAYILGKPFVYDTKAVLLEAVAKINTATTATEVIGIIKQYNLTWEFVPSQWRTDRLVWDALLPNLPSIALVRNLATLTRLGVLAPLSTNTKYVVERLSTLHTTKRPVHPMRLVNAWKTYGMGIGTGNTWNPIPAITGALETAFYNSFATVTPTGKSYVIGLDVSGSMNSGIVGASAFTPREAAAALSLVLLKTEANVAPMAFSHNLVQLNMSNHDSLETVLAKTRNMDFGATDAALPIEYAIARSMDVDAFVIITDNETNTYSYRRDASQALTAYNANREHKAKVLTIGVTATDSSIADPKNENMLDIVGFDPKIPEIISGFVLD